jgi:transposase
MAARSPPPGCYRTAEAYLRRCARQAARRTKGNHRRKKAVTLLAKAHLQVKRQRRDVQHKTSRSLVRQYDTVYHNDLQTANLVRNHHLAKSISDAGVERVPGHPCFHSSVCWEASCSCAACRHQPELLGLWA